MKAELVYCTNCHFAGFITENGAMCPRCKCIETMDGFALIDVPEEHINTSRDMDTLYKEYGEKLKENKGKPIRL